jgi:hypothetical protein
VGSYFSGGKFLPFLVFATILTIVRGSLHIHAKHVKCGGNDAVNELGTVNVLVVICRLSDRLNKLESNCCPRARSSPESFASFRFIKTIPAFELISTVAGIHDNVECKSKYPNVKSKS